MLDFEVILDTHDPYVRPFRADDGHFHQAALAGSRETRVKFHPVDKNDAVGLPSRPVGKDRKAVLRRIDPQSLHGGQDRTSHCGLGDSETLENPELASGGSTAVTPHGRENEGGRSRPLELEDERPHDIGVRRYSPASFRGKLRRRSAIGGIGILATIEAAKPSVRAVFLSPVIRF